MIRLNITEGIAQKGKITPEGGDRMLLREIERVFDPWREFEKIEKDLRRMERELERFFSDREIPVSGEYPPVNLWTNEEGALVTAELPGFEPEDVEITVVGRRLTIQGRRKPIATDGVRYHFRERYEGEFRRNIELPFRVDPAKVEAKYKNGILYVNLPRAENDKPKKIDVVAE